MRFLVLLAVVFVTSCGSDEVTVSKRPEVSYQNVEPAAGMTYGEFRRHEILGAGDMRDAQKRFMLLDRDNNGSLSQHELGGY